MFSSWMTENLHLWRRLFHCSDCSSYTPQKRTVKLYGDMKHNLQQYYGHSTIDEVSFSNLYRAHSTTFNYRMPCSSMEPLSCDWWEWHSTHLRRFGEELPLWNSLLRLFHNGNSSLTLTLLQQPFWKIWCFLGVFIIAALCNFPIACLWN